jgi:hypothetical protein
LESLPCGCEFDRTREAKEKMNDLSIRINAVDMASNVLSAVGENVKSFGQNAAKSFDDMARSGQMASAAASSAGDSSTVIVGGTGALATLGKALFTVAGGALIAAGAVAGVGVAAMRAAGKAEKELGKVEKTLKLIEAQRLNIPVEFVGGANIDPVLAKIKEVADQIENATGTKSGKVVDLAGSAVKQGFDPGKMDQAMKGAAGLASAFGTSLEDGLAKVRQAAEGNFAAFETLIPGIQNLTTDQEKLAAVSKLAADGLVLSSQAAEDGSGIFVKLGNGVGNLLERIGNLSSVNEIAAGVMSEILFPAIDFVDSKLFDLGATGDWLKDAIKNSFAFISATTSVVFNDMGLILERGKLSFLLFAEQSAAVVGHAFTVQIPEYAMWFGRNFLNILQDLAVGSFTIVKNMLTNLGDAFGEWWNFVTEGWSTGQSLGDLASNIGAIASRNLLDGFEPVTEELPQIAGRAVSNTEKFLLDQMAGVDKKLANNFGKAFEDSLGSIQNSMDKSVLNPKIDLAGIKPPEIETKDLVPQNVEAKVNQAFESRVQLRGPSDDPMSKLLDTQEKALKALEDIAAARAADTAATMLTNSQTGFTIQMVGN